MTTHVSAEKLTNALDDVLAAPRTDAPIAMVCTRPAKNQRHFPAQLTLSRETGVEGDLEMSQPWLKLDDGSPDPRIQVSILPLRVLNLVWHNRGTVAHPGDTIVADLNTTEESLPAGSLIRVGSAVLRVSDIWNRGCAKWRGRYGNDAYAWTSAQDHKIYRLRGILCSIEQDGTVKPGDLIVKA